MWYIIKPSSQNWEFSSGSSEMWNHWQAADMRLMNPAVSLFDDQ